MKFSDTIELFCVWCGEDLWMCCRQGVRLCRASDSFAGPLIQLCAEPPRTCVQGLDAWPRPPMQFSTTGGIPKMGEEDLVGVVKFGLSLEFDPVRVRPFPIF